MPMIAGATFGIGVGCCFGSIPDQTGTIKNVVIQMVFI